MEQKSEQFIYGFLKQYGKSDRTLVGKIINKIRKRDDKATRKGLVTFEDPESDFDF